jgi:ArsR family transcriptional regulator
MKEMIEIFKLLGDRHRVRILMLLSKKELSVCQLMGITGASQPLVSRNLSLLYKGGFLDERRDGKLRFYSIRTELSDERKDVLDLLRNSLRQSSSYKADMNTLKECSEFQKKAGSCSMKTLQEFMKWKKRRINHV